MTFMVFLLVSLPTKRCPIKIASPDRNEFGLRNLSNEILCKVNVGIHVPTYTIHKVECRYRVVCTQVSLLLYDEPIYKYSYRL